MSGLAATSRSAACWRTSVQLRTAPAAPAAAAGAALPARQPAARRGGVRRRAARRRRPRPARDRTARAGRRRSSASAASARPMRRGGAAHALDSMQAHDRSPRPVRARCRRRVSRSSTLALPTPRTPPKRCSSLARFFGPTPGMSSSELPPVRTLARRARMPVIAKRCASSRICATSISAAESRPRYDLGPAVGEDEFLEADLAALALLDADDARQVEAELLEHLARHARPGRGRRRPAPGRAGAPLPCARAPRPAWRSGASAPGASRRSRRPA